MDDVNLDLEFVSGAPGGPGPPVARVYVVYACSFSKDGGAPTLTADCTSRAEIEREVERLKGELDAALEKAAARFEGASEAEAGARVAAPAPAELPPPASHPGGRGGPGDGLRVRDVMTRDVKTLGRNDRVSLAEELMKVGRFRHVVVLDEAGKVAGVLSQRDIFYGALAWSLGVGKVAHRRALESQPVKEVMESQVITVGSETPLSRAAQTLMERKIGCLPVVDGDRLVGILTEGDFLAMLAGT